MKYFLFLILFALFSCEQKKTKRSTSELVNDTIPALRSIIKPESVASYSEKTKDTLNNWRFAVSLYETRETFKFLMKITYETLNESDTIKIPNFGITPIVEIKKGEAPLSCIIGFKGKEGEFKPYKEVSFTNKQLRIKTIQQYARTRIRKK
jgi:hypothetical protein